MKSARRLRESLPAIGLGTFLAFDRLPGEPREDLEAVMRQFCDAGGRVVDTSPLYGMGEVNVGDLAAKLGVNDQLFITNKIWSTGEYLGDRSHAQRSLEISLQRLWRKQMDAMLCHSLVNAGTVVPLLKEWRTAGLIKYAGVSHHEALYFMSWPTGSRTATSTSCRLTTRLPCATPNSASCPQRPSAAWP